MSPTPYNRAERWALDRPFLLSLIVLLLAVIPGFIRTEHAINEAQFATEENGKIAEQNRRVGACLTKWAADQTDALQDRDAVNKTARAAQYEVWSEVHEWLSTAQPGADREPLLESVNRFRKVILRLQRHEAVNPYPSIDNCFAATVNPAFLPEISADFQLVSYRRGYCLGRRITMWGSHTSDTIHGTDRADVIAARGGGDLILSGDGSDRICAGRGGDTINGGQGWDRVDGQRGDDLCIQTEREKSC